MNKGIIIFIVVVFLVVGGYFAFKKFAPKKMGTNSTTSDKPAIPEEIQLIMDARGYNEEEATQIFNSPLYEQGLY